MKRLLLLLAALLISATTRAQAPNPALVSVGDPVSKLLAECGEPASRMVAGERKIYYYSFGTVTANNDVITKMEMNAPPNPPSATLAVPIEAPQPANAQPTRPAATRRVFPTPDELMRSRSKPRDADLSFEAVMGKPQKRSLSGMTSEASLGFYLIGIVALVLGAVIRTARR